MAADTARAEGGLTGYYRALEQAQLAPLWESLAALAPFEPKPQARPFAWSYPEVRAHLMEAGRAGPDWPAPPRGARPVRR